MASPFLFCLMWLSFRFRPYTPGNRDNHLRIPKDIVRVHHIPVIVCCIGNSTYFPLFDSDSGCKIHTLWLKDKRISVRELEVGTV